MPAACGRASALGRSKVQGHAVPGRARARARQRAPEPPACRRANLCAGSGALTMEHGLRETDVVIMTAAAARAGSHSPWSLPGPWCAPRCRAAASAAGSSAPRRARCFIHPRVGGTRHGLALSAAFPRTSVGSAAVYFQFLLRAGSAGSSFGFINRRLQRPPPPRPPRTCVLPWRFLRTWTRTRGGRRRGLRGTSDSELFKARHFPDDL